MSLLWLNVSKVLGKLFAMAIDQNAVRVEHLRKRRKLGRKPCWVADRMSRFISYS